MLKEFKEFAIKGNALDLAVGVIIGAAFTTVVNSLVHDLFNPVISIFSGLVEFRNISIGLPGPGELRIGAFITTLINFLIIAFAVFLLVKQINRFRSKEAPNNKECPFCLLVIPRAAIRCPNCTSHLQ